MNAIGVQLRHLINSGHDGGWRMADGGWRLAVGDLNKEIDAVGEIRRNSVR